MNRYFACLPTASRAIFSCCFWIQSLLLLCRPSSSNSTVLAFGPAARTPRGARRTQPQPQPQPSPPVKWNHRLDLFPSRPNILLVRLALLPNPSMVSTRRSYFKAGSTPAVVPPNRVQSSASALKAVSKSSKDPTVDSWHTTTTAVSVSSSLSSTSPPKKRAKTENDHSTAKAVTPEPEANNKSTSTKKAVRQPDGWEDIYDLVLELRQDRTAPCDHSGCEALPDAAATDKEYRFQVLVSLILSSQTKDAVVGEAIRSMQRDGALNVVKMAQLSPTQLDAYIAKVGFHNNKTKFLKQVVEILLNEYDGDIPPTAHDMMKLPGVGPKMAYICESVAWDRQSGIGVDTHMHRLFNALRWVNSKTPEQTRIQLEAWLPHDKWGEVNLLWVGFGQEVQQFKPKILRKALDCSRPADALRLLKRCGLDYTKEGQKLGLEEEIRAALSRKSPIASERDDNPSSR